MYRRRPHPNLWDYEVVEWETGVHHEMVIPRGLSEEEVAQLITDYLLQYGATYPETENIKTWLELLRLLPGEEIEELEVVEE